MARLVAVLNQKGGVGKTTTVMSLAAVLAEHSRVLVVDVDPQESATWWANQAGEKLPFDITTDRDPSLLAKLRDVKDYDTLLIDTPGSLEAAEVLRTVIASSDFIILPTEPAPLSLPPLARTIEQLVLPTGTDYRILLNRVDPRTPADAEDARELISDLGHKSFKTVTRSYKAHSLAAIDGSVVTQYGTSSRAGQKAIDDYRSLGLELINIFANGN